MKIGEFFFMFLKLSPNLKKNKNMVNLVKNPN
jgi:hypothetical protein